MINNLENELKLEKKANQQYSEMLIEVNHKLQKIEQLAKKMGYKDILEIINKPSFCITEVNVPDNTLKNPCGSFPKR